MGNDVAASASTVSKLVLIARIAASVLFPPRPRYAKGDFAQAAACQLDPWALKRNESDGCAYRPEAGDRVRPVVARRSARDDVDALQIRFRKCLDLTGEPGWDRTNDLLIKSQLLYH